MRLWTKLALATALALSMPVIASAQYRDLDTALSNLVRGFGDSDTQAIIAGIAEGDQVQLQFPGLITQSGFFGRDQATYILEQLFAKAKPTGFEQKTVEKVSNEAQYLIIGQWNVAGGARTLYITLRNKADKWSIVSLKSIGK